MQLKDELLLNEFRGIRRCEFCGQQRQCDPHHLFRKGMGGGSQIDSRISCMALCRADHDEHHAGNDPTREQCLAIVAAREGFLQPSIEHAIHVLLRCPKLEDWQDEFGQDFLDLGGFPSMPHAWKSHRFFVWELINHDGSYTLAGLMVVEHMQRQEVSS